MRVLLVDGGGVVDGTGGHSSGVDGGCVATWTGDHTASGLDDGEDERGSRVSASDDAPTLSDTIYCELERRM